MIHGRVIKIYTRAIQIYGRVIVLARLMWHSKLTR